MANTPSLILVADTPDDTSSEFTVESSPVVVYAFTTSAAAPLSGVETATLYRVEPVEFSIAGVTQVYAAGAAVQLTATITQLTIREPGTYFLVKSVTTRACGLYIQGGFS